MFSTRTSTSAPFFSVTVRPPGRFSLPWREVLSRQKFDRYVQVEERHRLLTALVGQAELIEVTHAVRACRDPRDGRFPMLAPSGAASTIVSGDADLLMLHPFRGIPILSQAMFLDAIERESRQR